MNSIEADFIVVGAGLVGIAAAVSLAKQLGDKSYNVVLLDQKCPNIKLTQAFDSRVYAISPSTVRWLKELDVWQRVDASRISPIKAMHVFGDANSSNLKLLATDINAVNLGYIVENQQLMHALWQMLEALNIKVITGVACQSLNIMLNQASIILANQQVVNAKLLIAADGVDSWVRTQADITMKNKAYKQTAIIANYKCEKNHQDIARQWFGSEKYGSDSVLAFLPLPDNQLSIVWSLTSEKAHQLLNLSDEDFTKEVLLQSLDTSSSLTLSSSRMRFDLNKKTCTRLIAERVVLIGDAAHQIHPMAGQGVNLGFRDVMALEQVMAGLKLSRNNTQESTTVDVGSKRSLRDYERRRAADLSHMVSLTDGLHQLFAAKSATIKTLRNWGLSKLDNQFWIKKHLIQQAIK